MHAILCATPEEMAALRRVLDAGPQPEIHGPTKVWRAVYRGEPVVLAQAGIGKVTSAEAVK